MPLSVRPADVFVATKVTVPTLFVTLRGPELKAVDAATVVVPEVGDVWVSALGVGGLSLTVTVTVSEKFQVPVLPKVSESVPETG